MAPDSGDDDAAALRERVRELEQTVDDQQTTIDSLQEPTPSRRGVLAALTGVVGAGALGAYSQRGAAQAAGQVGTQSAPVDVEAYDLNVQGSLTGFDADVENPLTQTLDAGGNSVTNVGAVEADAMDIADAGVVSAGTLSAGGNTRITVNFSYNFATPPVIHVTPGTDTILNPEIYHLCESVTANSFDIRVENGASSDQTINYISWLAIID